IIEARVASRRGSAAGQVVGPAGAAAGGGAAPPAPGPAATPPAPSGPDVLAGQPTGTGPAAVLRIEPPTVYLLPSENTRVAPRALKDDGSPAAPVAVTWKSLRPEIASVDQNGVVIALAQGQGTVQVTSTTGLTATAPVVVQPSEIAIPEASPLLLSPGDVDTLRVVVPGQGGRAISPLMLQWSAADANVARVSLTGVVTAVAPGRTTLTVPGARRDVAGPGDRRGFEAVDDAGGPAARATLQPQGQLRRRDGDADRAGDGCHVDIRQSRGGRRRRGRDGVDRRLRPRARHGHRARREARRRRGVRAGRDRRREFAGRPVPALLGGALESGAVAQGRGRHRERHRAGVLARRLAHRVHLDARRAARDLRDGRGRDQRLATHQLPRVGRRRRLYGGRAG